VREGGRGEEYGRGRRKKGERREGGRGEKEGGEGERDRRE